LLRCQGFIQTKRCSIYKYCKPTDSILDANRRPPPIGVNEPVAVASSWSVRPWVSVSRRPGLCPTRARRKPSR